MDKTHILQLLNTAMMMIAELKTEEGKMVGLMNLPAKPFKSGSCGYYANTKVELDGKRYQVQMVEIGSKAAVADEDAA